MNSRILLASGAGAVAMFFWIFIAHMALPLGEAGISQIDNEEALFASMKTAIKGPGMYIFPKMNPGEDEAAYQKKAASGPSGIMVYHSARDFNFGAALAIEFVTELVVVLVGMYLLTLTRIDSFAGRLGFFAMMGFCVASANNVSFWNWYGFPTTYMLASSFTGWVGYLCAGLVAGAMKVGGTAGENR